MRKRIFTFFCIILLLVISITGLVGCVNDDIQFPEQKPGDNKPDGGNPEVPKQVTFYFTPVTYNGANYNGQTGVGEDTFVADLKSTVKVSEGTCMASITIKTVFITTMIDGVAQEPREATEEEFKKFKISQSVYKDVADTDTEITIKVVFGDFSSSVYYGAVFNFELQADPYIE